MKAITKTIIASAMLSSTILFTSCVSAEERQEKKLKDQLRKIQYLTSGNHWHATDVVTTVDHLNNNQEIITPKFDTRFVIKLNNEDDNYIDLQTYGSGYSTSNYYALPDRFLPKAGKIVGDHIEVDFDGTTAMNYPQIHSFARAENGLPIKAKGTIKFENIDAANLLNDVRAFINIRYTTTSDSIVVMYGGPSVPGTGTGTTLYTKVKDYHDFTESFTARKGM